MDCGEAKLAQHILAHSFAEAQSAVVGDGFKDAEEAEEEKSESAERGNDHASEDAFEEVDWEQAGEGVEEEGEGEDGCEEDEAEREEEYEEEFDEGLEELHGNRLSFRTRRLDLHERVDAVRFVLPFGELLHPGMRHCPVLWSWR